ncbi:MAG: LytTR family transcriptional regulator DNA-binding domain-containing protein, partial [Bacteroidales bacterium]|nr:LytTR family transcriptional regulator DNA-binding domain-containing protein [Bacteroidales bacterium]
PKDKFMRVHRSYIVNLDKINVIERARIVFDGDTFIPISEQYKDRFQAFLDKNFAQ